MMMDRCLRLIAVIGLAVTELSLAFPTATRIQHQKRTPKLPLFSQANNQDDAMSSSRRSFLTTAIATPLVTLASPQPAHAGLIQFPVKTLKNRYHFMRAGLSELEQDGIYSTNPLFLTNRENALVTSAAETKRVLESCATIRASANFPTVAYHSLAANGMDTAQIVAEQCKISRDRLLPEFTYLDQRGIGLWDSGSIENVRPAIMALDYLEAGKEGTGGRPPANEDGTPNETLADQFVRLRQFLSLQESRTSGENILIIFPDGTGPALLSAMIAGIPLNEAHCLDYKPGEVRLDISRESILEQYAQKKDDPEYLAMLEAGKEKLAELRNMDSDAVSLKDQMREAERQKMEKEFALKKQKEREEEARKAEEARQMRLQMEAERKAKAERLKVEREEAARAKKAEQAAMRAQSNDSKQQDQAVVISGDQDNKGSSLDPSAALGVLGVGALGAVAAVVFSGGNSGSDAAQKTSGPKPVPSPQSNVVVLGANGTAAVAFAPQPTTEEDLTIDMPLPRATYNAPRPTSATPERLMGDEEEDGSLSTVEDELQKLEAAQEALFNTIDNMPSPKVEPLLPATNEETETVDEEMQRLEAAQEAMNSYFEMDDGASDWLQVLAEIRDTPDEEADRVNGEGLH